MFAVIKTGGKQYRVQEGDVVRVEKLSGEKGGRIEIAEVLAVGEGEQIKIGSPIVKDAKVIAEIVSQGKAPKVTIFKKKRRKGYTKKQGHRQLFSSIRIKGIEG